MPTSFMGRHPGLAHALPRHAVPSPGHYREMERTHQVPETSQPGEAQARPPVPPAELSRAPGQALRPNLCPKWPCLGALQAGLVPCPPGSGHISFLTVPQELLKTGLFQSPRTVSSSGLLPVPSRSKQRSAHPGMAPVLLGGSLQR